MKNSILSQALESLETPVPSALPVATEVAAPVVAETPAATSGTMISKENTEAAVEKKLDEMSKDKLVMNAPLSTIFTRALNIQLAKKNVVTGDYDAVQPAGQTQGEAVALESQAQDYYYSAQARRIVEDALMEARPGDPTEPKKPEIPESLDNNGNGVKLTASATQQEVVKFFDSDHLEDLDPKFVFYQDVGTRTDGVNKGYWDSQKMILLNDKAGQGYVVESVEIVVHTRKVDEEEIAMEGLIGDFVQGLKDIFGEKSKKLNLDFFSYWDEAKANKLIADIKKSYTNPEVVRRSVRDQKSFVGAGITNRLAAGMSPPSAEEAIRMFGKALGDITSFTNTLQDMMLKYYGDVEKEVDIMLKANPSAQDWDKFNQKVGMIGFRTKFPLCPEDGILSNYGDAKYVAKFLDETDINQCQDLGRLLTPNMLSQDRSKLDLKTLTAEEVVKMAGAMLDGIAFLRERVKVYDAPFDKINDFINKSGKIDKLAKISSSGKIFGVQNAWNRFHNAIIMMRGIYVYHMMETVVSMDRWIVKSLK